MYLRNNIPFLVIACILCRVSGQKCYFPNGTAARTGSQTPCNKTTGAESMCCHSENIDLPDRCRADGLCIPSDNEFLWRNGCTDPTWKDPACLNICVDGLGEVKARPTMYSTDSNEYAYADNFVPLTSCADGSLCCATGADPKRCCAEGKGVSIVNGKVVKGQAVLQASTSASSTPSPTTATAGAVSGPATPAPTSSSSSSSNTGAIVGGVVGGIAGIVALALTFWYFMIRHNLSRQPKVPNAYEGLGAYEGDQPGKLEAWQEPTEAPASDSRRELDSMQTRQELEGRQGGWR
ncbi:MAG: hypothetical protein L6R40_007354 [Gallowayella cf. fulva]|nr:MAG: hypothetical protein L6R40_007354 [Xanthomendoza cf. fulva]